MSAETPPADTPLTAGRLREIRRALGLTQGALAERIGISVRQLQYYERGEWPVPRTVALAVAAVAADLEPAR